MSDFFISAAPDVDLSLLRREMRFTDYTQVETGIFGDLKWAVSRVDDWALWGPAWDPESHTRVLLAGRIALDHENWAAADRLPFEGGLAARWLLARWREEGARGVTCYNGAAVVAIIDERTREAHVWTDRMGFFPAFAADSNGAVISSHPDLIARACAAAGRPLRVDDTTIAELLRTGGSTHPHTYWRGVRQLDAARKLRLSSGGALNTEETYWRPAYLDGAADLGRREFVEAFASALTAAGRRRTQSRLGKPVVLLSSGADSRGVLCATRAPADVDCYTYFDEPNVELEGARRIAQLSGAAHYALRRTPDYYVRNAERTVALSGGMWGIESGHHTGFAASIRDQSRPGVVLTGCYCDYLFKGLGLNRRHIQFLGRNLPLYATRPYEHEFYQPHSMIDPRSSAAVEERLQHRFGADLQTSTDPRQAEFARLAPISREADASGRFSLWRTLPFDVIVSDNSILDVYGRLSVADKLSGIAFGQAIARVTGAHIASVSNSNFGAPVGTDEAGRVSAFLLSSLARKLKRVVASGDHERPESVATLGSWPNLTRVALGSPLMHAWFEQLRRGPGEMLLDILHPGRRDWSFETFATHDVFQLYRLVTADLWLRQSRDHGRDPIGGSAPDAVPPPVNHVAS